MKRIAASVNVRDVYHALSWNTPTNQLEESVIHEIKRRFERQGVVFETRHGLFPIPPYKLKNEILPDGFRIIQITQDQEEEF
jgi:hypothetical protein